MLPRTMNSLSACNVSRALSASRHSTAWRRSSLRGRCWRSPASTRYLSCLPPNRTRSDLLQSTPTESLAALATLTTPQLSAARTLLRPVPTNPFALLAAERSKAPSQRRRFGTSAAVSKEAAEPKPQERAAQDEPDVSLDLAIRQAQTEHSSQIVREQSLDTLRNFMRAPGHYADVWSIYCALDNTQRHYESPPERHQVTRDVIVYLANSTRTVEMGRVIYLGRQVPADLWNDEFIAANVSVYLRANNYSIARDYLTKGLQRGLWGGVHEFVEDAIIAAKWSDAVDVWNSYYAAYMSKHDAMDPADFRLPKLQKLPDLGRTCLRFERFLAKREGDSEAVALLRRELPMYALLQPCGVPEAMKILSRFGDHELYRGYMVRVLQARPPSSRGRMHLQHNKNMLQLYQAYRQLPGFKPPVEVLIGMFDINFPDNHAELAELYEDWLKSYQDLNLRGYQRFLKYYSREGNMKAVKTLWNRFAIRYKGELRVPRGFRSLLNVYAQVGDLAGAKAEFEKMQTKYGVRPDTDSYNLLLKAHMRVNDFKGAEAIYNHVRETLGPNAFTFSHMMTIYSKQGNLDKVLEVFDEARKENIPISQEMVLALVNAYCENDRVREAERICVDLAGRGITSAAIWNKLIDHYGMQGNLGKSEEMFWAMIKARVAWNSDTITNMLHAMVKVKEHHGAFRFIKRLRSDRIIEVAPEHFSILLYSASRAGDADLVDGVLKYMNQQGVEPDFAAHVAIVESLWLRASSPTITNRASKGLVSTLERTLSGHRVNTEHAEHTKPTKPADAETETRELEPPSPTPPPRVVGDISFLRKQTQSVGRAIMLLSEMRDLETAEELINLYMGTFTANGTEEFELPTHVAAGIMFGYFKNRMYSRVVDWWRKIFDQVNSHASDGDGGIHPAYAHALNKPVYVMIRMFERREDGQGLRDLLDEFVEAGYKMTSIAWNHAVQTLAKTGQRDAAFKWCERELMAEFKPPEIEQEDPRKQPKMVVEKKKRPERLPLEERRRLHNSRLRHGPTPATLELLKNEWYEMGRLAAWSGEVSTTMEDVRNRYPRLHYAFILSTAERVQNKVEGRLTQAHLKKAIRKLLRPYDATELVRIKTALKNYWYEGKRKRERVERALAKRDPPPVDIASELASLGKKMGPEAIEMDWGLLDYDADPFAPAEASLAPKADYLASAWDLASLPAGEAEEPPEEAEEAPLSPGHTKKKFEAEYGAVDAIIGDRIALLQNKDKGSIDPWDDEEDYDKGRAPSDGSQDRDLPKEDYDKGRAWSNGSQDRDPPNRKWSKRR
ncbi:hypothetical protein B0I35DRAFT_417285 [Stachybotrys elegans]|uniref:Pentacotripeptide-repeat region of PRORP domain-containing protein n=1 Tax=Stachybotrys elegans TaxID=80388 RepID=A0A8K0T6P6_9HYPO|nr:hypothetical protein B0I35DRAFT_417285 [Stachybotrys elegans]